MKLKYNPDLILWGTLFTLTVIALMCNGCDNPHDGKYIFLHENGYYDDSDSSTVSFGKYTDGSEIRYRIYHPIGVNVDMVAIGLFAYRSLNWEAQRQYHEEYKRVKRIERLQ